MINIPFNDGLPFQISLKVSIMGMGEAEIYERWLVFLIVKTILIIFSQYPV